MLDSTTLFQWFTAKEISVASLLFSPPTMGNPDNSLGTGCP